MTVFCWISETSLSPKPRSQVQTTGCHGASHCGSWVEVFSRRWRWIEQSRAVAAKPLLVDVFFRGPFSAQEIGDIWGLHGITIIHCGNPCNVIKGLRPLPPTPGHRRGVRCTKRSSGPSSRNRKALKDGPGLRATAPTA